MQATLLLRLLRGPQMDQASSLHFPGFWGGGACYVMCAHAHTHECVPTHLHARTCIHAHTYVNVHVHMHIRTCAHGVYCVGMDGAQVT